MTNILKNKSTNEVGAKLNLTVDISPEDCFTMTIELFSRLSEQEQNEIIKTYMTNNSLTFCGCANTD